MKKITLLSAITFLSFFSQAQCDTSRRPVIFIHGFLASGDTWSPAIQRFIANGYCADRLFVFDWNSVNGTNKRSDSQIVAFVKQVLAKTGAAQVDLVGHSAGGVMGRGFLVEPESAAMVAHYVNIGSRKWFADYEWFPNLKCLNIYSAADMVMGKMGGNIEHARNVDLVNKDHYEVATCETTTDEMIVFLSDYQRKPLSPTNTIIEPIQVSGKAVLLGTNEPMSGAAVNIYAVNPRNGKRLKTVPDFAMTAGTDGRWGPVTAKPATNYEMELRPADTAQRTISYFFEPFRVSDPAVYLRGFPSGNMVAMMLGQIPKQDDQSALVIYASAHAIIQGRDSVAVNKIPVTSAVLTPASKTIISTFVFDDGDGISSGKSMKQFGVAPFLGGVDISLPASLKGKHTIYFNGRTMNLPARSSKDCILLAVFR